MSCVCCSGQIGSLQATQMTHEAVIRDLESEKSRLKDKVLRLEEERGSLQNKCHTLDERQRQQIVSLEKVRMHFYRIVHLQAELSFPTEAKQNKC